MSFDGDARNDKAKTRPGSHAKEGNSFRVTTLIVIPVLAIVVPAIVAIYIAKSSGGTAGNQPRSSAPLGSLPSSPFPSAASGKTGSSASVTVPASPSASDPTSSGNTYGANGQQMYTSPITLNGHGCDDLYTFQVSLFKLNGVSVFATSTPPSGTFGVDLFCSPNTSGGKLDPNIQFGGNGAFVLGSADFRSCYSKSMNSTMDNKVEFSNLYGGAQLCILSADGNELALFKLTSVSTNMYLLQGTVTVWRVQTSSS